MKTHGLAVRGKIHPLYKKLKNIEARCRYPSATHYEYYGGKGISVCAEWLENPRLFVAWANENGWKPGLEVDRKDGNGNYCPENCQVTTHQDNSQRRRHIKTTPEQARIVKGRLLLNDTVKNSAKAAGVSYMVAWHIKNDPLVWGNV